MILITPQYAELCMEMHAQTPSWGAFAARRANMVRELVEEYGYRHVIDYGCGKGALAKELAQHGIEVAGYDPGVHEFSVEPVPRDLVVCMDVMEHVEPRCLDNVLEHISMLAMEDAFFTISTMPAKRKLPDGRNAHLIVENEVFWKRAIKDYFAILAWGADATEIHCLAKPKDHA